MSPTITVYEEYASNAEKRRAQRGAKHGKPTGKARGYFFAFTCNGYFTGSGGQTCIEGQGNLMEMEPGDDPGPMCGTSASVGFLREKCRRVGGIHLPPKWKAIWEELRKPD